MKAKQKKVVKKVEPQKKTSEDKSSDKAGADEKVFDVLRPGRVMPSASSRPLIVTHKPGVGDPMVSPANKEKDTDSDTASQQSAGEGAEMIMTTPKKNRIEPLHSTITTDEDEEATNVPADKATELSETSQNDTPKAPEATKEDDETSDEIAHVASEVSTKKQAKNEAAKKEEDAAKKQTEIDALIASKQFYVPIDAVKKRRTTQYALIVLCLVILIAVGLFVALDAGYLDIGIDPPTDFIKDK